MTAAAHFRTISRLAWVFLLVLCGCSARRVQAPTSTARAALAQPTPVPSLTAVDTDIPATPSATVPVALPTAALTKTPTPEPTASATPLPTPLPTGMLAELPLPPRAALKGNADDYELAQPAPETLLDFIEILRRRQSIVSGFSEDFSWSQTEADRWDGLASGVTYENKAVLDAIDNTFLRAYPSSLPEPEIVLEQQRMEWWTNARSRYVDPYPPRYLVDMLLTRINQNGKIAHISSWTDATFPGELGLSQFVISASPAELDGKADQEWIIYLQTPYADIRYTGLQLWQAVDELPGPTYQVIGEPVIAEPFFYAGTFAANDLTGDGRTDLITEVTGTGFGMQRTNFTVYQWTGKTFKQISYLSEWIDLYMSMEEENEPRYQMVEGSGLPALRLVEDINNPWGCNYQKIKTYRWPGGREQRQETNTDSPNSPACLLADAGNVEEVPAAVQAYQRALAGFNAQDPQDWPMVSFAHYRLALLYALQGNDAAARQHIQPLLDGFQDKPKTAQYLQDHLAPLLKKERVPVINLCSLGFQAGVDGAEVLDDWFTGLRSSFGGPFPDDVCPPETIARQLLERAPVQDEASLLAYLQASGANGQRLEQFAVPDAQESAWMLEMDTRYFPSAYMYLPTADGGKWEQLSSYSPQETLFKDRTGDGAVEAAFVFLPPDPYNCDGQQRYDVYLTGRFDASLPHYLKFDTYSCQPSGEPLDLNKFLADGDGDGIADRLAQEARKRRFNTGALESPVWPTATHLYDGYELERAFQEVAEQEKALFSALYEGGDPEQTRAKLLDLREKMLADGPGQHAGQQIDYLVALSYELEGNEAEALRRYLALAQQEPQTMWTSLAAARLKAK